jgi:hypothetical protein
MTRALYRVHFKRRRRGAAILPPGRRERRWNHGCSQGTKIESGRGAGFFGRFISHISLALKFNPSVVVVLSLDLGAISADQSSRVRCGLAAGIRSSVFGHEWNHPWMYTPGVYG